MPAPLAPHRLPSRRLTAALAAATLLAGAGVGAALPAHSASNRAAAARSALAASLLGALAADRSAAASAPKETSQPSTSGPAEPTVSESAAKKSKRTRAANAGAGAGAREQSSAESAEAGSEAASEEAAPESTSSPAGSGSGSQGSDSNRAPAPVSPALLAQITHVWVITLSGGSFEEALDHRDLAPYLTGQLLPKGTLLTHYSLVADSPLANDLALLSGQGPNPETERDCPSYTALTPGSVQASGLASGSGCVYPAGVQTLADEVTTAALSWRAYLQDMAPAGASGQAAGAATTCRHPQPGDAEPSAPPSPGEDYLVSRNPFVYFDSLIESHACEKDDVDLSELSADLAAPSQTPGLSWIVPSACDDGSQLACGSGDPGGLAGADAFLKQIVPQILATTAYREHGLILLVFDSGPAAANATAASAAPPRDRGAHRAVISKATEGATVGALIVSPFVNAGTKTSEAFDTYSLLRSLERLFGVPLLGHAADQGVAELGAQVYRSTSNTTAARSAARRGSRKGGS
jgi:phosphatidylinositol-3-phosphatase